MSSTYEVEVQGDHHSDFDRVEIEAESREAALQEAASYEFWEIGVEGRYHGGFEHFTVVAVSREAAEEKLLGEEDDAVRVIENSQFKLGDVAAVESRREA